MSRRPALLRCPQCRWSITVQPEAETPAQQAYDEHEATTGHFSGIPFAMILEALRETGTPEDR